MFDLKSINPNLLFNKGLILMVSILFAGFLYHFIIEFVAPAYNVFAPRGEKLQIPVYTGTKSGFYHKMGHFADTMSSSMFETNGGRDYEFVNRPTRGGLQNLDEILSSKASIGFVSEVAAPGNNFSRKKVNFITPMYVERLHIVYNKKSYRESWNALNKRMGMETTDFIPPEIKSNPDEYTLEFLNNADINGGPHRSATRLLASYLITSIEKVRPKYLHTYKNLEALSGMFGKKANLGLDIHFFVVGTPNQTIYQYLDSNENMALMSIDPSFMATLNQRFGLNLRLASFDDKYIFDDDDRQSEINKITTLGTYTYLVASKGTPMYPVKKLLRTLGEQESDDFFSAIGDSIAGLYAGEYQFELDEIDLKRASEKLDEKDRERGKTYLLSIGSILGVGLTIFWILTFLISKYFYQLRYKEVSSVYNDYFEFTRRVELIEEAEHDPNAVQKNYIKGLNKAFIIVDKVYAGFRKGILDEDDHQSLIKELRTLVDDIQIDIHRYTAQAIIRTPEEVSLAEIDELYFKGCINSVNWKDLRERLGKVSQ